jgi:phosphonate transport system substrate-binding protein
MRARSKRPWRGASLAFISLFVLWTIGCDDREAANPLNEEAPQSFRLGLIPEQNLFHQMDRYEPLAAYLSTRVGVKVELKVLPRYADVIDGFVSRDIDGAFLGSLGGALALVRLGVEPLARPEWTDGTSTYRGLIIVRKDSGIATGADMKGKRFVFVDTMTTAGWLLPLHYFKDQGIDDYRSWFKEFYFAGTHDGAIVDVLEGRADVGGAKSTVFDALTNDDPRTSRELSILAESPEVPANGLFVRKDIDGAIKNRLKLALLGMGQDEESKKALSALGASKFVVSTPQDYKTVFEYAESVDIDLRTYDYMID